MGYFISQNCTYFNVWCILFEFFLIEENKKENTKRICGSQITMSIESSTAFRAFCKHTTYMILKLGKQMFISHLSLNYWLIGRIFHFPKLYLFERLMYNCWSLSSSGKKKENKKGICVTQITMSIESSRDSNNNNTTISGTWYS